MWFYLLFCGRIGKPRCEKLYTVAPLTNLKTIFNFYLAVKFKYACPIHIGVLVGKIHFVYTQFPANRERRYHLQDPFSH